jgi:hypothetical protein
MESVLCLTKELYFWDNKKTKMKENNVFDKRHFFIINGLHFVDRTFLNEGSV